MFFEKKILYFILYTWNIYHSTFDLFTPFFLFLSLFFVFFSFLSLHFFINHYTKLKVNGVSL